MNIFFVIYDLENKMYYYRNGEFRENVNYSYCFHSKEAAYNFIKAGNVPKGIYQVIETINNL